MGVTKKTSIYGEFTWACGGSPSPRVSTVTNLDCVSCHGERGCQQPHRHGNESPARSDSFRSTLPHPFLSIEMFWILGLIDRTSFKLRGANTNAAAKGVPIYFEETPVCWGWKLIGTREYTRVEVEDSQQSF